MSNFHEAFDNNLWFSWAQLRERLKKGIGKNWFFFHFTVTLNNVSCAADVRCQETAISGELVSCRYDEKKPGECYEYKCIRVCKDSIFFNFFAAKNMRLSWKLIYTHSQRLKKSNKNVISETQNRIPSIIYTS